MALINPVSAIYPTYNGLVNKPVIDKKKKKDSESSFSKVLNDLIKRQ